MRWKSPWRKNGPRDISDSIHFVECGQRGTGAGPHSLAPRPVRRSAENFSPQWRCARRPRKTKLPSHEPPQNRCVPIWAWLAPSLCRLASPIPGFTNDATQEGNAKPPSVPAQCEPHHTLSGFTCPNCLKMPSGTCAAAVLAVDKTATFSYISFATGSCELVRVHEGRPSAGPQHGGARVLPLPR